MISKYISLSTAFAALLLLSTPVSALEVEEAGVEKGEVEVVYEGSYTDDNGEGVFEHEHEVEVEVGLFDWLKVGLGVAFEEEEGERDFEFSEIEAAATIALMDPEKNGFGFSLYGRISKEFAADADEPDEKEFALGVIAETEVNKILFRGNLFYISDIDAEADERFSGVEYAYRISYQITDNIGLGVEGYGSHKDLDDPDAEDKNAHKIGPVIYFSTELGENGDDEAANDDDDDDEEEGTGFEAQFGVLFGTNDDTPDVTLKWNLGLEF